MQTLERLIKVFQVVFEETIDPATITPETSLRDDIGISSIGLLYMAMAAEEEFGIKFTNEDFPNIKTVADVIACIESKCQ